MSAVRLGLGLGHTRDAATIGGGAEVIEGDAVPRERGEETR